MAISYKGFKESPFFNQYGGLSMVNGSDGKVYLRMEDCTEDDYFGPLTPSEVTAFNILCDAKPV